MKVGILAGGLGSRLAEETEVRPKPMVEIGGQPILWHIMKIYEHWGYNEFSIALGYKGEVIKRWFADYTMRDRSIKVHTRTGQIEEFGDAATPDWHVDLVETGSRTLTGGRIKRLRPTLGDETALVTWGDGVADIDLSQLVDFHRSHGRLATLTAVRPPARYGHLQFDGDRVASFTEKPQIGEGWINGAFFVLEPEVDDYISGDDVMFEHEPLSRLAEDGQLMAFRHTGFWQCMDTTREKKILNDLWDGGDAAWKVWGD